MGGTRVQVEVDRVVDGDTVRVKFDPDGKLESLRLMSLDTEESNPGVKPLTPWGKEASKFAKTIFKQGEPAFIEFPGNEPKDVALEKHRDKHGRLLVYIYDKNERDFQELMIKNGYSPYFMKYGYAIFEGHHQRYLQAEREAQVANIGVWDQETVNGYERRNYAALGVWWDLRARLIQGFRDFKAANPEAAVFDPRLDIGEIRARAESEEHGTVFVELSMLERAGSKHGKINSGTDDHPFTVFIPDMYEEPGQAVVQLLRNRYLTTDLEHPRRNFAYVSGHFNFFRDTPQVVVTEASQICDVPPPESILLAPQQ